MRYYIRESHCCARAAVYMEGELLHAPRKTQILSVRVQIPLGADARANKGGVFANNSTDTMPAKSTLVSPRPASDAERFSHETTIAGYLLLSLVFFLCMPR